MPQRLRTLFAKREDPYAGVDLANASRFGGALWFIGALLTALLMPFAPLDKPIGNAGWAVAAAVVVLALASGARMRAAGSRVRVNEILLFSYAALAGIAILVWLSGGVDSPYAQMFVLSALYTCAVHPPRRVLVYLVAFAVSALLPLAYDSSAGEGAVVEGVTEVVVWIALALVVLVLMHYVRMQRLGLRREGEHARRQARLDPLTGLLNRRAFDEDLGHAVDRARASGQSLSVLVADLDGFKDFNDRFGHLAGDRVLEAVAGSLRSALRRPDVAYRWGGDEFAVVLPEADRLGAERVAGRVSAAVAGTAGPDGGALTIATGVAEFDPRAHAAAAALLDAADQALLRAKGSENVEIPR